MPSRYHEQPLYVEELVFRSNLGGMKQQDRRSKMPEFTLRTNEEAAGILGISPVTMKISRSTGTLLGVPAPRFLKMGRLIRYEDIVLQDWIDQFRQLQ